MNELITIDEQKTLWDFSNKLAKSAMIPTNFRGKVEDIFVTILYGREFGISPINALNSICLIQGQVTMKAATMNAIVRARFPKALIDIKNDQKAMRVIVTTQRSENDIPYVADWDMARAEQMGLTSKHNWKVQPLNMLRARALSEALRTVFADVLMGLYSTEEMQYVEEEKPTTQIVLDAAKEDFDRMVQDDIEKNPQHYEVGAPTYMIQNGSKRGKQLQDIDQEELADYVEKLEKRERLKTWESELLTSIRLYLSGFDKGDL